MFGLFLFACLPVAVAVPLPILFLKHVLFQFLCNVPQCCNNGYDYINEINKNSKLNNHKQVEIINITQIYFIRENINGKNER